MLLAPFPTGCLYSTNLDKAQTWKAYLYDPLCVHDCNFKQDMKFKISAKPFLFLHRNKHDERQIVRCGLSSTFISFVLNAIGKCWAANTAINI